MGFSSLRSKAYLLRQAARSSSSRGTTSSEGTSGSIQETQRGFHFPLRTGDTWGAGPPPSPSITLHRPPEELESESAAADVDLRRFLTRRGRFSAGRLVTHCQIPRKRVKQGHKKPPGNKKTCRQCDISALNTRLHVHYEREHESRQLHVCIVVPIPNKSRLTTLEKETRSGKHQESVCC